MDRKLESAAARFREWLRGSDAHADPAPQAAHPDQLERLALDAYAYAEQRAIRSGAGRRLRRLDCKVECAYCCALPVSTSYPEALAAWRHARRRLDPGGRAALLARVRTALRAGRVVGVGRRPFCPFLDQDRCLVYSVRPLACRAWTSYSVAACARACTQHSDDLGIPADRRIGLLYRGVSEALVRGLEARGLSVATTLVRALGDFAATGDGAGTGAGNGISRSSDAPRA